MRYLLLLTGLLLLLLCGCASRFETAMEEIHTGDEAERRFGLPTKTEELDDGGLRREWLLHIETYASGGGSGGDASYQVSVGSNVGGIGIWLSKLFWPEDSYREQFCHLEIVTNKDGGVIQKRWRGNDCERLLANP